MQTDTEKAIREALIEHEKNCLMVGVHIANGSLDKANVALTDALESRAEISRLLLPEEH